MPSILFLISCVALAVCLASSLISFATTANPLPASPTRAAPIVALKLGNWSVPRSRLLSQ